MKWDVSIAKNGEVTLQVNDIYIYSKYQPIQDSKKWIQNELDKCAESYLLIGLGLGYHLKTLCDEVTNKPIIVYYFEKEEYELFKKYNEEIWWRQSNICIVNDVQHIQTYTELQILIPNAWTKALGESHPLYPLLDTIKINQRSYKKFAPIMARNFERNVNSMVIKPYPSKQHNIACLVSAGPSLNETINWLKHVEHKVDIYVVGSALKKILIEGIVPKCAIITDATEGTIAQLLDSEYTGDLFYLCTANYKTVAMHEGPKYIIFQQGYKQAESLAEQISFPLLETGGSVATTTFSLIEHLAYTHVILFGQDFGYTGNETHAIHSTSRIIRTVESKMHTLANDGTMIYTSPSLQVFWRWFSKKVENTVLHVYNTAAKGAKIEGVPFIDKLKLIEIVDNNNMD